MANFKKWVNKLAITMGLLAILAAPVAFGATEASAWRCWILWWRWCQFFDLLEYSIKIKI